MANNPQPDARKSVKTIALNALGIIVFALASNSAYAFCAGAIVKEIQVIAKHKEVIDAVKHANAHPLSEAKMLALDARWIESKGKLAEAEQILASPASEFLIRAMASRSYFKEAILTGKRGETVAMNLVTSDYWQGDEEKFTEIFDANLPSRKPDSYISRARWDESTNSMISQVSVPVYDGRIMVGTLTVGIDLKRVPPENH